MYWGAEEAPLIHNTRQDMGEACHGHQSAPDGACRIPQAVRAAEAHLQEYRQRYAWLWSLIQAPATPPDPARPPAGFSLGPAGALQRLEAFLRTVGDPHRQFAAVHVAGTSGKTSVTTLLARMLGAAGYRTGYHVSPYLQLPHEKLIIDEKWISVADFNALLADFAGQYGRWQRADPSAPRLRYGEAWVTLTFLFLARARVDWGIVECGLGGRWDPTNVLHPRLSLVTNIGRDHLVSLGGTLESIAEHKAGIIKPHSLALTGVRQPALLARLQAEARRCHVDLHTVGPATDDTCDWTFKYRTLRLPGGRIGFSLHSPYAPPRELTLPDPVSFQVGNAAQAVAALDLLQADGQVKISAAALQQGLDTGPVPGRMEILHTAPPVVVDCAHNPPKMRSLVAALQAAYPRHRFHVLTGMLRTKDAVPILEALAVLPGDFRFCQPRVFGKASHAPGELRDAFPPRHRHRIAGLFKDVGHALDDALTHVRPGWIILVTGSVYLAGEARDRWHPRERLLRALACPVSG